MENNILTLYKKHLSEKTMIILLSPSKIQYDSIRHISEIITQPVFMSESECLVKSIRKLSVISLAELLKVKIDLAKTNAERYARWQTPFTLDNASQAVMLFNGEAFHGLNAGSISVEHFSFLQDKLRIFSGLYGILKPFDLIQPYRLDMGDRFKTDENQDLYSFWSTRITNIINQEVKETEGSGIILNLSSVEYFKVLDKKKLNARIINVDFLENRPDGFKNITIYTKKARGLLARFVTENEIEDPEYLKAFDYEGYMFNFELSTKNKLIFTR